MHEMNVLSGSRNAVSEARFGNTAQSPEDPKDLINTTAQRLYADLASIEVERPHV